jgi:hypothetical protein
MQLPERDYDSIIDDLWRRLHSRDLKLSDLTREVWKLVAGKHESLDIARRIFKSDSLSARKRVDRQLEALYHKTGIDVAGIGNVRIKRRLLEDLGERFFFAARPDDRRRELFPAPLGDDAMDVLASQTMPAGLAELTRQPELSALKDDLLARLERLSVDIRGMPSRLAEVISNTPAEPQPDYVDPALARWLYAAVDVMNAWILSTPLGPEAREVTSDLLVQTLDGLLPEIEDPGTWGHHWYPVFAIAYGRAVLSLAEEVGERSVNPSPAPIAELAARALQWITKAQRFERDHPDWERQAREIARDAWGKDYVDQKPSRLADLRDVEQQLTAILSR